MSDIPLRDRTIVLLNSGGVCAKCGKRLAPEIEQGTMQLSNVAHIIPSSSSPSAPRGEDVVEKARHHHTNLIVLCGICHDEVDDKDGQKAWPRETLLALKASHEQEVERRMAETGAWKAALDELGRFILRDDHTQHVGGTGRQPLAFECGGNPISCFRDRTPNWEGYTMHWQTFLPLVSKTLAAMTNCKPALGEAATHPRHLAYEAVDELQAALHKRHVWLLKSPSEYEALFVAAIAS